MTEDKARLMAVADNFLALNGGGEGDSFLAVLGHIWGVDMDDDDEFTEFMYRLGTTLLMLADQWREHGIPEVQTRWTEQ